MTRRDDEVKKGKRTREIHPKHFVYEPAYRRRKTAEISIYKDVLSEKEIPIRKSLDGSFL